MMMTLERALTLATGADNGELNPLWREVVETLAKEVKRAQGLNLVINNFLESVEISEDPSLSFVGWLIVEEMYRKSGRQIPAKMEGLRK